MSKGVALVTGSGQGIGRAIALRLADDQFDVAINDIPPNKENLEILKAEIEAKGRRALIVIADVSQEEQVQGMVDSVVKTLGGLDVVRIDYSS
jgi:NAD(P)-dependent dehydrogenase (short-subunit alcohol dehydrogenase family)